MEKLAINENVHYNRSYGNLFNTMAHISRTEGPLALFNGLTASMVGLGHVLIYFPLYENLKARF